MSAGIQFEWTEKLAVGSDILDMQHQEIFIQTNRLLDILVAEEPRSMLHEVLAFLDQYIHNHFESEYAYMRKHAYPLLDEHHALHEAFIAKYTDFKERIAKEGPTDELVIDLENYLGSWLVHHIGEADMQYANFVKSLGTPAGNTVA